MITRQDWRGRLGRYGNYAMRVKMGRTVLNTRSMTMGGYYWRHYAHRMLLKGGPA